MRVPMSIIFALSLALVGITIQGADSIEKKRKQEVEEIQQKIDQVRDMQKKEQQKEIIKSLVGCASFGAAWKALSLYANKYGGQLWYRPTPIFNIYTVGLGFMGTASGFLYFALDSILGYYNYTCPPSFASVEELDTQYKKLISKYKK